MENAFDNLLKEIRACDICKNALTHGVRPVLQANPQAKILVAGQAPGIKVHESGVPFDDASGKRLREWMGVSTEQFYDPKKIAIVPMGFCYPGTGKSGDLAPRRECAENWRQKVLDGLPNVALTLLIGKYAQDWHLSDGHKTLTENVRSWSSFSETVLPLPHPSPRNNIWLKKNLWFENDVLPALRHRVAHLV
ncbi:MAG: uracil-DNA glycosylase family protein [Arenicella sp.]